MGLFDRLFAGRVRERFDTKRAARLAWSLRCRLDREPA